MSETITVYHGTTADAAGAIVKEGFSVGTCIATDESLAWYYAETAAEEIEDAEPVVISFSISVSDLEPDMEAMAEPVGYYGKTGAEIEDELEQLGDRTSLQTSMSVCASARLGIAVAGDDVTVSY